MKPGIRKLNLLLIVFLFFLVFSKGADAASTPQVFGLKVRADHLLKRGETDRAILLYENVLKQDRAFANAYYNLATAYYLRGDLGKAAENLEAFLALRPEDAEALYNLGCLKMRLGRFDEAMKCFLRAENCPCTRLISRKIKEALHFMKDLKEQDSETRKLLAYLLSGSTQSLIAA